MRGRRRRPAGRNWWCGPRPTRRRAWGSRRRQSPQAARIATVGDIDANVAKLDEGERRIPIRVRLPEPDRTDLSAIKNLRLPTAGGGLTTLGSVADVYFQAGPAQIDRVNREREITAIADTIGGLQIGDAQTKRRQAADHAQPAGGSGALQQGQEQAYAQLFAGFAIAILSAIGLVYGVMVLLFRSFFKPLIILSALPTAIGGALAALLATDLALRSPL